MIVIAFYPRAPGGKCGDQSQFEANGCFSLSSIVVKTAIAENSTMDDNNVNPLDWLNSNTTVVVLDLDLSVPATVPA